MSDQDDPDEAVSVAGPEAVEEIHAMPDPMLMAFVEGVNRVPSGEIGLTLHVSGVVVSGILVSGRRFFEQMAQWLKDEGAEDLAENFADPVAEMFAEPDAETADDEQAEPSLANFIHLRAARVFTSGSDRPLPETFWRGRLSQVSAWSIGTMSASEG